MAAVILRISASILLLVILTGRAQTPVNETRTAVISDPMLRSLLRALAVDFTEESTGDSPVFAIQLDGHAVMLRNRGQGLSVSACFEGEFDPHKANQWNRQHFSTRAYLGENGCTSLGSDVTFGGGATGRMIQDFVHVFCTDVVVFARFLASARNQPDTPSQSPAGAVQSPERLAEPFGAMAWSQVGAFANPTAPWRRPTGSVPGLLKIDPRVSLKYDTDRWKPEAAPRDGRFALTDASGAAHALVISERIAVPLDSVEDIALANAQSVDPHATVVFRHRIWANGVAYWFLKMEATVDSVPIVYWGHFYVSEAGTVQVVAYTEKSRLPEYEQAFTDFLKGVAVSK